MAAAMLCGCLTGEWQQTGEVNASATKPPNDNITIFRLYDDRTQKHVPGTLINENQGRIQIPTDGAEIPRDMFKEGPYMINISHRGGYVFLPFVVDKERLEELKQTYEYTLRFDSTDLDKRFFTVIDENTIPLMGVLSLDGEELGVTDEYGVITVNITKLHPGKMLFTWYSRGRIPASWELEYIESDMRYLYLQIPVTKAQDKTST